MYSDSKLGLCLDISGPEGNVFCLMGIAKDLAKQLGKDPDKITEKMKESDYDNAVAVFKQHFPMITIIGEQNDD